MLQHLKTTDIDAVIAACQAAAADNPADPEPLTAPDREHIYDIVDALPREAQDELLALMWTGGPKNTSSFEDNLDLAQKTAEDNHAAHLAEQGPRLPGFLKAGLAKLGPP